MLKDAVPSLLQHVRRLAASAASDEQLLADFLTQRSDEAFSALLGRHGPMVFNVCRRILHDVHDSENVFQATFLVLADRAGAIQRRASLAGFLHGVAYRLAVRARRRRMSSLPTDTRDKTIGPSEELAWKEMLGILDHELGRLSDRFRAPLVLCYLEGRTQDEAARQLGWSLNTLRRRLAQARGLLGARLRSRGVTLPAALTALLAASAVPVPGPLRAATLAEVGARAVGGAAAHSSFQQGMTFFLATAGKKVGAFVVVTALASAICFAYCWVPHADQTPPAAEPASSPPAIDPLPTQGAVRLGTARYRHGSRIESFAVSADDRFAAVSSGWRSFSPARVFDLTDGRCLYSLPHVPDAGIEAIGLSPDGKILATKDNECLSFRDAATGKAIRNLKYPLSSGGRSVTNWLTFTPDGKQVAATLMADEVNLIDVETAKVIRTFKPGGAASAHVFSPDGKQMATAGYEKADGVYLARLWDMGTGKELRRFPAGNDPGGNGRMRSLAFSPDGAILAGAGWGDGRLRFWETATGKELRVLPSTGHGIQSLAFAPDGKTIAAAADRIYLYHPATGKERLRIERQARGLAFSRDGSVLTGAVNGAIYRWDTASGRQLTPVVAQDSGVEQILVSPDSRNVFTTDRDGDLYAWYVANGKAPRRIVGGTERGIVASPDGRFLAWTVAIDAKNPDPTGRQWYQFAGRVRLYDVVGQKVIDRFAGFPGQGAVVGFLPDGKTLLTLDDRAGDATVRLWDVESGKEQRSFAVALTSDANLPAGRRSMRGVPFFTSRRATLSTDGKSLSIGPDWEENLSVGYDEPVRVWDVATGKVGPELKKPTNAPAVPDEAGRGKVEDLSLIRVNRKMNSSVGRAFSPDGRFLADWALNPYGRSRMDHVVVWNLTTGRVAATLSVDSRPGAANAAFAPDGRTLAIASADGTVRLWEVTTWKVRAEYRGHRDQITAVTFGPDGRLFTGGLDTVVLGWDIRPPRTAVKAALAEAWENLAHSDAKAGFQAQGRFLAEPGKAVEWFAARIKPVIAPDPSRVKALVADLDKDNFATRERATAGLKELWPMSAAALREVVAKPSSLEARRRAEQLIEEREIGAIPPHELRAQRAVEVLEWIGTKEARVLLLELAKGAPEAALSRAAAAACKRRETSLKR